MREVGSRQKKKKNEKSSLSLKKKKSRVHRVYVYAEMRVERKRVVASVWENGARARRDSCSASRGRGAASAAARGATVGVEKLSLDEDARATLGSPVATRGSPPPPPL